MYLQFTSCVYGNNLKPSEQMIAEDDEDDELFFVVWFIEERLLTLFPVGAIVTSVKLLCKSHFGMGFLL